jgi:ATP phosphoribosyltransferase
VICTLARDSHNPHWNTSGETAYAFVALSASSEKKSLRLAVPNGSLQQPTIELFCRAGYDVKVGGRSYYPTIADDEIECLLVRPQEQPRYVQDGLIDVGITGYDWIRETEAKVIEIAEMMYSKVSRRPTRWVLVVPEASPIHSVGDLSGKRIATELVRLTREFLAKHSVQALVEYSYGATEVKPPILADAIVDATETGTSLRANSLRIIETVIESTPRLIASPAAWSDPWKRQKIEDIALMLNGAMAAEGKVWLSMNALRTDLNAILAILPALDNPTVASLSDPSWVDITTIVDENVVRVIVPKLKKAGARGIVEYPLNKIIE